MSLSRSRLYDRFLGKAEANPAFIAHALAKYRANNAVDDAGLARFLGCAGLGLRRLKACLSPDLTGRPYRDDVRRIADFAGCDATRLLTVLKQAAVLDGLRGATAKTRTAIAARDLRKTGKAKKSD